jgi:hypothetical protein
VVVSPRIRRPDMPTDTVLALFAIVIPFALFATVLAWAQSRTG